MPLFSERYRYTSPRESLQIEEMDNNLRIGISNMLYAFFAENRMGGADDDEVLEEAWTLLFHKPASEYFDSDAFLEFVNDWIPTCAWYEPYDLIEFIANKALEIDLRTAESSTSIDYYYPNHEPAYEDFCTMVNRTLLNEHSGYRMIKGEITPITNESEILSIEESLDGHDVFSGAKRHMQKALELFSVRPNPDFENVIKESISAVESALRVISGNDKHTLSQAIKAIKPSKVIHPTLLDAWDKLYAFTSDASGVRHGFKDAEDEIDGALAKYYLVSCSAILNLLISIDSNSLQ